MHTVTVHTEHKSKTLFYTNVQSIVFLHSRLFNTMLQL